MNGDERVNNVGVATVDTVTGVVRAVGAGAALIVATVAGVSGSAPITVESPPAPPPPSARVVIFQSDWSTAQGTSSAALRDAGKSLPWDVINYTFSNNMLDVISAANRGFPAAMANILRVRRPAGSAPYTFASIAGKWAAPAVGEATYYRIYLRNEIADAEGNPDPSNHHPVQTNPTGPWSWKFTTNSNGTFPIRFTTPYNAWPLNYWILGAAPGQPLSKNTTYRLEWMVLRTADARYEVAARIHDAQGTLLWSEDGVGAARGAFMSNGATSPVTMKSTAGTLSMGNNAYLANLEVGTNGGPTYTATQYFYFGGVMVCRNTWCGPY